MTSRWRYGLVALGLAAAHATMGCGSGETGNLPQPGYKPVQSPDSPGTITGTGPVDSGTTSVPDPTLDAGPPPAEDAGPTPCNDVDNTMTPSVQTTNSSQQMPQGMGGSFLDGIYELTNVTQYGGGTAATWQATTRVESAVMSLDMIKNGSENRVTMDITYNGTGFTVSELCGTTDLHNFQYSADPSEMAFTLYSQETNLSFTYTQSQ